MRAPRRRWLATSITAIVAIGLISLGGYLLLIRPPGPHVEARPLQKPEAPPDIAKFRDAFTAGLDALRRKDGDGAVRYLSRFEFRGRLVEEYRLYYLAVAHELRNQPIRARLSLATLWHRDPQCVCADATATKLASSYAEAGDWLHAAGIANAGAARSDTSATAAKLSWQAVEAQFYRGDVAGALESARGITIRAPAAAEAAPALSVVRSVEGLPDGATVPMTAADRLERAVGLLRDRRPDSAYGELTALAAVAPESIELSVQLNRGLALAQMRRFDDSNRLLEPLASGPFKFAIPAIEQASKNYQVLSASINPVVNKVVVQKQKVGTRKVRVGKGEKSRVVTRPKYANVKKTIQLVDLAKKAKKDSYDKLATERLKDLLQIPQTAPEIRLEALNALIGIAEAKHQEPYEQQLVQQVVALDRYADPALQHFWDKAWAAYARGDLNGAKPLFRFIADTYANPNVRRQSEYWYARSIERTGQKAEAAALYEKLAAAPYEDLYAMYAERHGAHRLAPPGNPLKAKREDWNAIAEKKMPPELRLAYELTGLSDMTDAQLEIRKNANRSNQQYADAMMADLYNSRGDLENLYRAIRRAFPQLATVEQDTVPPYFLKMYYPVKYVDSIRKYSYHNGVDPYLVMALILQESYFDPKAKSRVGAIGLMQLMPATGKELGERLHGIFSVRRLDDPDTNIQLGTMHLKYLIGLFNGNDQLAVASYNAGQGNVLKWRRAAPGKPMDEFLESIPFPETRNYVKRVTLLRSSYSRMAQ